MGQLARDLFVRLSMHAKLQRRLDELNAPQGDLQRIEEQEILAYNDDTQYAQLEQLKRELLGIGFLQEKP
jgi:hypothetical protein